ncbi:MAG: hypothetical protein H7195_04715 [Chryseobacterium sp.]|nr:hypothetical protein [Chryseobacterium sp.]
MSQQYSKILQTVLFSVVFSTTIYAQPRKGEFVNASIGLGISTTDEETEYKATGYYFQAEYVFCNSRWLAFRPYLGVLSTSNTVDGNNLPTSYIVTTQALLLGGKARFCAPIPYVAPYIDLGLGASIGTFRTFTPLTNEKKSGVIPHFPFSIGLLLGKKHNFDVAFTYYYQSAVGQTVGAAAFGVSFPAD